MKVTSLDGALPAMDMTIRQALGKPLNSGVSQGAATIAKPNVTPVSEKLGITFLQGNSSKKAKITGVNIFSSIQNIF